MKKGNVFLNESSGIKVKWISLAYNSTMTKILPQFWICFIFDFLHTFFPKFSDYYYFLPWYNFISLLCFSSLLVILVIPLGSFCLLRLDFWRLLFYTLISSLLSSSKLSAWELPFLHSLVGPYCVPKFSSPSPSSSFFSSSPVSVFDWIYNSRFNIIYFYKV